MSASDNSGLPSLNDSGFSIPAVSAIYLTKAFFSFALKDTLFFSRAESNSLFTPLESSYIEPYLYLAKLVALVFALKATPFANWALARAKLTHN